MTDKMRITLSLKCDKCGLEKDYSQDYCEVPSTSSGDPEEEAKARALAEWLCDCKAVDEGWNGYLCRDCQVVK